MQRQLLRLDVSNIMRISTVRIEPNGAPALVLAGENESGKSSVLTALEMLFAGPKKFPREPLRRGTKAGQIVADLGDIIVTRRITPSGQTLEIRGKDDSKYGSPQAMLDAMVGQLTFDPLAFATQDATTQARTLRLLAGIQTDTLDAEYKKLFDERTDVNRDLKQSEGALVKAARHADAPAAPIDGGALIAELAAADELAKTAGALKATADKAHTAVEVADRRRVAAVTAVEDARAALEAAEQAEMVADETYRQALDAESQAHAAWSAGDALVPDRDALRRRFASIEQVNAKVRDNQAHAALQAQADERRAVAEKKTSRLNDILYQKSELLRKAKFPVEGLGLSDDSVTWEGLPFAQASTAVRIRASVAIGLALNPELRVLMVRNGNDLGQKNLHLIAQMAEAAGATVLVERISGGDGLPTVVIEDGTVVSAEQAVTA